MSKKYIFTSLLLASAIFSFGKVSAKADEPKRDLGSVTGSFETNTTYYVDDEVTGAEVPDGNIGSNNYLKVDYTYKGWSAGVQAEWYPQVLVGYDKEFDGFALPSKYISWQGDDLSVTIGDFYEQFGSGLVLRSWEDRALGFNNSLGGARITYNINDFMRVKALSGVAREYMSYSQTLVSGADLSLSLSDLFKVSDHYFTLEGSYVNRYEMEFREGQLFSKEDLGFDLPQTVFYYSGRAKYEYNSFYANYEYVYKSADIFESNGITSLKRGQAHLVDLGYSTGGLSLTSNFRYLDKMISPLYRTIGDPLTSNTLNYIPTLTPQNSYSLTTLHPYEVRGDGEMGGQVDLFYRANRNTWLGGSRGLKLHANYSLYYATPNITTVNESLFQYRELTMDVDKSWNKHLQTVFMVSLQKYNNNLSNTDYPEIHNAFIADITYKLSRKNSLRAELQYLDAQNTEDGDWMAAQFEFNMAPKWSLFVSDMYNHGNEEEKSHYYSGGASFTHASFRTSLSYGRYREGIICSGGVCRNIPAYTGLNLSVTVNF